MWPLPVIAHKLIQSQLLISKFDKDEPCFTGEGRVGVYYSITTDYVNNH
jgi:hypothetical protein